MTQLLEVLNLKVRLNFYIPMVQNRFICVLLVLRRRGVLLFPCKYQGNDDHGKGGEDDGSGNENTAIHKELVGHRINDGIRAGVKHPVVLAGEKDGVE